MKYKDYNKAIKKKKKTEQLPVELLITFLIKGNENEKMREWEEKRNRKKKLMKEKKWQNDYLLLIP